MKVKNREFEIYKTKWNLEFVDFIETDADEMFRFGECNPMTKTIRIAKKDLSGKPIDSRDMVVTLMHELVHCILDEGNYEDVSGNESLVEWMAKCMTDLKEQGVL